MQDATSKKHARIYSRPGDGKPKLSDDLTGLALIAGVLLVFVTITFLIARCVTYLLGSSTPGVMPLIWAITTLLAIVVVRLIPFLLDRRAKMPPGPHV
jgi:hypothetical protein